MVGRSGAVFLRVLVVISDYFSFSPAGLFHKKLLVADVLPRDLNDQYKSES